MKNIIESEIRVNGLPLNGQNSPFNNPEGIIKMWIGRRVSVHYAYTDEAGMRKVSVARFKIPDTMTGSEIKGFIMAEISK